MLNGTRNPFRSQIAKDIRDAILISTATKDKPAAYWPKEKQYEQLVAAYEKWDKVPGVWSAAAEKVGVFCTNLFGVFVADSEPLVNDRPMPTNSSTLKRAASHAPPKMCVQTEVASKDPIKAGRELCVLSLVDLK